MSERDNRLTFAVTGMSCAACSARVEKALNETPGVLEANVNLATHRATVEHVFGAEEELSGAVEGAGYGVVREEEPDGETGGAEEQESFQDREYRKLSGTSGRTSSGSLPTT